MGYNVPLINRDSEIVKSDMKKWTEQPGNQKKLVLVIVSIALLLDNMLYMVIVPILPTYLRDIHAYVSHYEGWHNESRVLPNGSILIKKTDGYFVFEDEDMQLGWLFASKALVQIFINPFSGYIIDRVGYEIPMILGLTVMFISTAIFAIGRDYTILFIARSLQGLGSAFADTSGLAMIADRFTEDTERSAALGIALAFISFGCLVAPPFGATLHELLGKPFPFLVLSCVCLVDALAVFMVIQPGKGAPTNAKGEKLHGTPMWRLFMDPLITICSGALIMANVSLAFLEPTITKWIKDSMEDVHEWQIGAIWLPAFFPHVLGVYVTVWVLKRWPRSTWIVAIIGLAMEGISCLAVPFMTSVGMLIIPLSFTCFGIALIDTSLLPMLGHLVDTRHVSVYGSVYAIADISYSLAYAFGPIVASWIVKNLGFTTLNIIIFVTNVAYCPVLVMLRNVTGYDKIEKQELNDMSAANNNYGQVDGGGSAETRLDGYQSYQNGSGNGYQDPANTALQQQPAGYDPLNPQW